MRESLISTTSFRSASFLITSTVVIFFPELVKLFSEEAGVSVLTIFKSPFTFAEGSVVLHERLLDSLYLLSDIVFAL